MTKRRLTALLLSFLLCMTLPAAASQPVEQNPYAIMLPEQLNIAEAWACGAYTPMQAVPAVIDGDAATTWDASNGGADDPASAYLMLSLETPSIVTSVWVRNGAQASSYSYYTGGYPTQLRVHLWRKYPDGSSIQAAQYTFPLDTAYQPNAYGEGWYAGYQQLQLPVALEDISSLVVYVEQYANAYNSTAVQISDIAVCGTEGGSGDVYVEYPPVYWAQQPVTGVLLQKIATRTGPGTHYTEPGTFFAPGDTVQVISLAYDHNDVPWVQVDFTAYGGHRRAYTGLKRIDLTADMIPLEFPLNESATMRHSVTPRTGPGTDYAREKDFTLTAGQPVTVLAEENGWLQLEIVQADAPDLRVWVEEDMVRR